MARVHSAIARKDYPEQGIAKGDKYWYWTPYRGRRRMSKTPPKPSQSESNPTRASYLAIQEGLSNDIASASSIDDLNSALESAADEASGIAEELREKASNIEDGFQHETELSSQFNEQADEVDQWAETLRGAQADDADEPEEPTEPERAGFGTDAEFEAAQVDFKTNKEAFEQAHDDWEQALEDARAEAEGALGEAPEI